VRRGQIAVLAVGGLSRPAVGPRQRIAQEVGLLSEDRKGEGLALIQSIADNLTYTRLRSVSHTHPRAHEPREHFVCGLRPEKNHHVRSDIPGLNT